MLTQNGKQSLPQDLVLPIRKETTDKEFSKQVVVNSEEYLIKIGHKKPDEEKPAEGVADAPSNANNQNAEEVDQLGAPLGEAGGGNPDFIDKLDEKNSMKQENNSLNVLAMPNMNVKPIRPSSSTAKSSTVSRASMDGAIPLKEPNVSPQSLKVSSEKHTDDKMNVLAVPEGVAPVPKEDLKPSKEGDDKNDIAEDVNVALPGRYRNNIIEVEQNHKEPKGEQQLLNDGDDKENGAHEVFDLPGDYSFYIPI